MKKLNNKAFYLIMAGLVGALIYALTDAIIVCVKGIDLSQFESFGDDVLDLVKQIYKGTIIFVTVVMFLIYGYFIFRLLKNKKAPAKQGYITFLFVVCIIGIVLNLISLIGGEVISLISLALDTLILVGCSIQRKYLPTDNDPYNNNGQPTNNDPFNNNGQPTNNDQSPFSDF